MLVRFNVENFLSFNDKNEFSMIKGKSHKHSDHVYEGDKVNLLKSSYLYGANASGKTNFIKSIEFAKDCILNGIKNVNTLEKNYKLDKNNINKTSTFEFEILINDKIYAYGFSLYLAKKEIYEEWLYEVLEDEDLLIFGRKYNLIEEKINLSSNDKIKFDVYKSDLKKDDLFLNILSQKTWEKDYEFEDVINWFKENLIIIFPETNNYIVEFFENKIDWVKYLKTFGIDIVGIEFGKRFFKEIPITEKTKERISNDIANIMRDENREKNAIVNINNNLLSLYLEDGELKANEILFKHSSIYGETIFKFYEESDGTKRLLELLPLLEKVKNGDYTILIDELERSLHPILVKEFLNIFSNNMKNTKSQLILTTHETRLLDLRTIRRDEVWFAEIKDNATRLFSLEEFKTRFDLKLDKAYLLGRYGGIPNIDNYFLESDDR